MLGAALAETLAKLEVVVELVELEVTTKTEAVLKVVLRRLKEELAEAGVMSDLEVKWTELRWC